SETPNSVSRDPRETPIVREPADLARMAEEARLAATQELDQELRSDRGQFFTPWPTASLMASMSTVEKSEVRLLDAGAGTGSLTVAWLARACAAVSRPTHVAVTAYEADKALIPFLRRALRACEKACERAGIRLSW